MQTYIVTWEFESAEDQSFALKELISFYEKKKHKEFGDQFQVLECLHMPQDGTGVLICKASSFNELFKVFNFWRENFGIKFDFKPGFTTNELVNSIKHSS
tara:strand:- start:498 stop:797 length:300 start_codon:yes stop_codon:yes gene_type:complete